MEIFLPDILKCCKIFQERGMLGVLTTITLYEEELFIEIFIFFLFFYHRVVYETLAFTILYMGTG